MTTLSPPPLLPFLQVLALRLSRAGRARDWHAVDAVERALAEQLRRLEGHALGSAERSALQQLRGLHDHIALDCDRQLHELRETLALMQQRRAGWNAYAESQDWSPEGTT